MTAIVGLVDRGSVYIGGDSAGVAGLDMTVRTDAKVFLNGPYVFGFTTSFRMGQLIRWALVPPVPPADVELDRFMATTFVDALRECLKAGGFQKTENGRDEAGKFLVGVAGRLFMLDSDYQVGEPADPYAAVGCGAQVALGALYATADRPESPRFMAAVRVRCALEAAERFSAGVRGPFVIKRLAAPVAAAGVPGGSP